MGAHHISYFRKKMEDCIKLLQMKTHLFWIPNVKPRTSESVFFAIRHRYTGRQVYGNVRVNGVQPHLAIPSRRQFPRRRPSPSQPVHAAHPRRGAGAHHRQHLQQTVHQVCEYVQLIGSTPVFRTIRRPDCMLGIFIYRVIQENSHLYFENACLQEVLSKSTM